MANYMTVRSAPELLSMLTRGGFIEDRPAIEKFVLDRQSEVELPLYVRALVGVGAVIASTCFIGFLAATDIISFEDEINMLIWGLIFMAGAIGLQRLSGEHDTVTHSFLLQASFAAMAAGKSLFVFGMAELMNSGWGATLATLLVTVATYHIYRMSIDRFLSSFAVLFSILANILWSDVASLSRELLLNGFFAVQLAGAAILLTHGRIKREYVPLAYAFAFSLCASVLYLAAHEEFGDWRGTDLIHPAFVNTLLAGALIALFAWTAGGIESLKREPLALASVGAVLLGLISAPGVILSIGLMVIGYAKHEKLLLTMGGLLMPAFLFLYYYNLDVSLLSKSLILAASGTVLLAGRLYLTVRQWDKGV